MTSVTTGAAIVLKPILTGQPMYMFNQILVVDALPTVYKRQKVLYCLVDGSNWTGYIWNGSAWIVSAGGSGGGVWGSIIGTLADQTDLQNALNAKANSADLGAVATSNDYNDLDNLPSIPAAQVNSDWNAVSGVAEILNKPTITSETKQTITISVADWSGGTTAVKTVTGVTATSFQDYYFGDTSRQVIITSNVRPTGQGVDEITFTADSTPTADITLTIVIKEVA